MRIQVVSLIGFYPFKQAADALANINAISEGVVTEDLKLFLETNMPKVCATSITAAKLNLSHFISEPE
jgi:hypothetical protein